MGRPQSQPRRRARPAGRWAARTCFLAAAIECRPLLPVRRPLQKDAVQVKMASFVLPKVWRQLAPARVTHHTGAAQYQPSCASCETHTEVCLLDWEHDISKEYLKLPTKSQALLGYCERSVAVQGSPAVQLFCSV